MVISRFERNRNLHYCSYVFFVFVFSWFEFKKYIKDIRNISRREEELRVCLELDSEIWRVFDLQKEKSNSNYNR